jgi:hypothetical protein
MQEGQNAAETHLGLQDLIARNKSALNSEKGRDSDFKHERV